MNSKTNEGFQLYLKYFKKVKRKYGIKGSTYNTDLDKIGKKLIGKSYIGTFAQNTIPINLPNKSYFITNLDFHNTDTERHWVAFYYDKGTYYCYDSYGRKSKKILAHFFKKIKGKIVDSDNDAEQRITAVSCGARCIAWLMVVKKLGVKKALKI